MAKNIVAMVVGCVLAALAVYLLAQVGITFDSLTGK